MKKEKSKSMAKSNNRRTLMFIVSILIVLGAVLLFRGYFLSKKPTLVVDNIAKYNSPLELTSIPKLIESNELSTLPQGYYNFGSQNKIWFKVKTDINTHIGYINEDLIFTQKYFLPSEVSLVNIYQEEEILFVLESSSGIGPRLIYISKEDNLEILELSANEYFTGYYYSFQEQLFYISKGNAEGQFEIFTLNLLGQKNTLYTTSTQSSVIKARSNDLIFNSNGSCFTLKFMDKSIKNFNCNEAYRNISNLTDIPTLPSGIIKYSFKINNKIVVVNEYYGLQRILSSSIVPISYTSYPIYGWEEINFTQDKIFDISYLDNYMLIE